MGRIHRHLKTRVSRHGRVGATSAVYMAAICEYREFLVKSESRETFLEGIIAASFREKPVRFVVATAS